MGHKICALFFVLSLTPVLAGVALCSMSSDSYSIPTSVLSGGGARAGSTHYLIYPTLGQPSPLMDPADPPLSGSYDLYPGFWYTLGAGMAGCGWDLDPALPDGDVDGSDLARFIEGLAAGDYDSTDLAGFTEEFGSGNCF